MAQPLSKTILRCQDVKSFEAKIRELLKHINQIRMKGGYWVDVMVCRPVRA